MANYRPTAAVMKEATEQLMKLADDKGLVLSLDDATRIKAKKQKPLNVTKIMY